MKIVFSKGNAKEETSLGKGLDLYKRRPNEKPSDKFLSEIAEKNVELGVFKKRVLEAEERLSEQGKKVQELEEQLSGKDRELTIGGHISGQIKSEETERLTMAAHKTIQTLQAIISDKNDENDRKDRYLDKLKQEFYLQKENDALEIRELYEQIRVNNQDLFQRTKISQGINNIIIISYLIIKAPFYNKEDLRTIIHLYY